MNTIKLLLISVGLCLAGFVSAQSDCTIDGPSHPLKPKFRQPRIKADTANCETHMEIGKSSSMYPNVMSVRKFHENGRIDTIFYPGYCLILKYSDKDQLLSKSFYAPGYVSVNTGAYVDPWEVLNVEYEYGEDGRLTNVIDYGLDENGVHVDTIYTYNYTMTDSGYIIDDVEYILDDQGRLSCLKYLNSKDEYVYDDEGRRFRSGDVYYSYFENHYSHLSYYHQGINILGAPDSWAKEDYFFEGNGYLSENISYLRKKDETEWKVYNHYEWSYAYRDDNPLANIAIEEQPQSVVYATAGAVVIEMEKAATVSVYSFSGQLVTQQRVSEGTSRIALSKGMYIIAIEGKGYKIAIK